MSTVNMDLFSLKVYVAKEILEKLHANYTIVNNKIDKSIYQMIISVLLFELIRGGGLKSIEFQGNKIDFKFYAMYFPIIFSCFYYNFSRYYSYLATVRYWLLNLYKNNEPSLSVDILSALCPPNSFEHEHALKTMQSQVATSLPSISKFEKLWPYLPLAYFILNCLITIPSFAIMQYNYDCNWINIYDTTKKSFPFIYSISWYMCELESIRKYALFFSITFSIILITKSIRLIKGGNVIINNFSDKSRSD
jgi:hypothetical protein